MRDWLVSIAGLALITGWAPALAQSDVEQLAELGPAFSEVGKAAQCVGGAILDDGTYENGLRTPFASDTRFVQRFTPASYPALVSQVCVCWKTGFDPASMGFSVVLYDDNGISGQPGTLLGSKSSAVAIPTAFGQQIVDVACADLNVTVASGSIYLGPQWNASGNADFFVCSDESASTTLATMYRTANGGVSWTSVVQDFPNTRALGVRAELPVSNPNACVPDTDTLCLNGGRFKVEATYQTAQQNGHAQVVKLTDETGYLWFFNANNVESVVKVLNACGVNNRYWVFAAGLTNQGVDITITDTLHPTSVKHYVNPLNTTFVTKTDTDAFATCP
ncbi:MAG TPA: hypothetical protein VFS60_01045 [Thermoanaerobaculia bacterium]|nr:hypothetical protein [Thermoanaerobaculia bacterium]